MNNKIAIRRIKDRLLDCSDRLELIYALILNREEIYTSGIYSERVCLSEEVLELADEQLDSLVNDLRLLVESGFNFDDDSDRPVDDD